MSYKSVMNNTWKFIKKTRASHLIWLSVGLLIPMYADILFINDINSSTVSAVMDTVMATTAAFVAFSWFYQKKKLNTLDTAHKVALEHNNLCWNILKYYQNILMFYQNIESMKKDHGYIDDNPVITGNFMINSQNEYLKIKNEYLIISSKINHFNVNIQNIFLEKEMIEDFHKFTSKHQSIIIPLYNFLGDKEDGLRVNLNSGIDKIISEFYSCEMIAFVIILEENLNNFKIEETYSFN
ncbi:hypothetical protein EJP81_14515 [Rahnella aquatilis]|nr:hypothetical protein EJP79_14510 [Rahnella aquatilis]AZP47336.1 hypothetical protein EJP81_14515 [Rahnella aquatilis]